MADRVGQQLGNYRLLRVLGKGGFGEVYEAEHILLHRKQAIKLLLEQHFSNSKFGERFLREAQTLAALDHPNIVHVDELGIQGELVYLVMPFISGGTLHDVLKQRAGPLGLAETRRYLEQICAALRYAHSQHVVHLDLKPLNLLIHQDGRLLLSDFGLAHLMKQGVLEGGTSLTFGSPYYMAPEHLRGQPDWRSDIYALGVMLYQMLAGRLPFEGSTPEAVIVKHVMEPPPALRAVRPDLPERLEQVLHKALAKDPQQRFASVGGFASAFEEAVRTATTQFVADNPAQSTTIRASTPPASATQVASTPPYSAWQPAIPPAQVGPSFGTPAFPPVVEPDNTFSGGYRTFAAPPPAPVPVNAPAKKLRLSFLEFAIIIGLVAIVVIAILVLAGPQIGHIFSTIPPGSSPTP